LPHLEGIAQVFHAFFAVEACLGGGVPDAPEAVEEWDAALPGEPFGKDVRLVKAPLPLPRGVERHGHEALARGALEAWIVEGFPQPADQDAPQVEGVLVFQAMDQFPHGALAPVAGDGAGEGKFSFHAGRADKGAADLPRCNDAKNA